jgi:hypothetical protein
LLLDNAHPSPWCIIVPIVLYSVRLIFGLVKLHGRVYTIEKIELSSELNY